MNDRNPIVATDGRYDYRVLDLLGQEPGGELYLGEAVGRGDAEPVALRTFSERSLVDARFRDRLLEAVKLHRDLQHAAVHPLRSLIELHHAPTVVFAALHGRRLRDLLEHEGALPIRSAAALVEQLASGLHALHHAGFGSVRHMGRTHQDLHPGNILVTHAGEARMLEVGTARARIALDRPDIRGQAPMATYAAPERKEGKDHPRADVFALGVVFAECLTGLEARPLPPEEDAHAAAVAQLVRGLDGQPEPVLALLREMLAWSPDDRPAAREVGRRLRALTPDLPGPWLTAWAGERIAAPAPIRPTATATVFEDPDEADVPAAAQDAAGRVEALRPLKRARTAEENRRATLRVVGYSVGGGLLALFVGLWLTKPELLTRWWVDNQGAMDQESVETDLPGPSAAKSVDKPDEPTVVTVSPGEASAGGAGSGVTSGEPVEVKLAEGATLPEEAPQQVAGPKPRNVAAPAAGSGATVVIDPEARPTPPVSAPDRGALPAGIVASTNPDEPAPVAQPERSVTLRDLQRRFRQPDAPPPPFGEDFEDAPDDAQKVAVEVGSPRADTLTVVCADGVRGQAASTVLLSDVPVGRCDVQAIVDGVVSTGSFTLSADRRVECRWEYANHLRCW